MMKNSRGQDDDGATGTSPLGETVGDVVNATAITGVVGGSIRTARVPSQYAPISFDDVSRNGNGLADVARKNEVIGRQECYGARS
jgi:hypothetical protein